MDELISRQAAIDAVRGRFSMPVDNLIVEVIGNLPSAQPECKKGKWIIHPEVKNVYGGTYIECSECGEKYIVQHIDDEKFCRNCGADMRGEKDEIG